MTGRTARSPGSWLWIALATCGTACGGNVTSGSGEDGPPGPGETPDDPLPTRAFEVEAGPRDPDDPDDLQAFTVPPGEEEWICVTTRLVNQERVQARRVSVEPGAGVARVDVNAIYDDPRTGLDPCEEHVPYVPLHADGLPGFDPDAPENSGLAFELPPHATVALWLHALNVTDRDVIAHAKVRIEELREPATHVLRPLFWNATAPDVRGEEQVERGSECAVESERRIAALTMHTHDAHTLSSRVTLETSSPGLLYSLVGQWPVPLPLFYDSLRANGISLGLGTATGTSGIVTVLPRDQVGFRCAFTPDEGGTGGPILPRDFACTVLGSYTAEPGSDAVWRCE